MCGGHCAVRRRNVWPRSGEAPTRDTQGKNPLPPGAPGETRNGRPRGGGLAVPLVAAPPLAGPGLPFCAAAACLGAGHSLGGPRALPAFAPWRLPHSLHDLACASGPTVRRSRHRFRRVFPFAGWDRGWACDHNRGLEPRALATPQVGTRCDIDQRAAARIAFLMRAYVPHRQMLVIAPSISVSVGFGILASSAAAAMMTPGWQ